MTVELPQSESPLLTHIPSEVRELSPDLFNYLESMRTYLNQIQQGLFANDLAINSIDYILLSALDTDATLAADSDDKVVSQKAIRTFVHALYPIGSIYINATDDTNPETLLGFGTWTLFGQGRVLVGFDSEDANFDAAEETGGAKTVTLTAAQSGVPVHNHVVNILKNAAGGSVTFAASNNNSGTNTHNVTSNNNTAANAAEAHSNLQPYITVYMWKRGADGIPM